MNRSGYQLAALSGLALAGLALASSSAGAAEPAQSANPAEPPAVPVSPPSAQPTPPPVPSTGPLPAQKGIVDAVWANAQGDPTSLAAIARQLVMFPGPLRAYVLAATREGQLVYKDQAAWIRDFNAQQTTADKARADDRATGEKVAGTTAAVVAAVGTAAAVANAVPIVGQVISAALALSLAVAVAITEGYKLPVRTGEDQIHDAYEGLTVFYGLSWAPNAPDDLGDPIPDGKIPFTLKRAVIQDPVAFLLPQVPLRTAFPFAPSLQSFREAAHELKLYAGDS